MKIDFGSIIKNILRKNQLFLTMQVNTGTIIFFWGCMKPNSGGNVPSKLENKIKQDFGSFEKFREEFINARITQFGSGWCWLSTKEISL